MKTNFWQRVVTILAVAGVAWSVTTAPAQDPAGASTVPPAAVSTPALQLAYGVPQILQLAQAKVGDATIIAYIKNSGNSYGLSADQIIYLRQQGVSDAVVTVMLSQPRAAVAEATPAQQAIMPTDAGGQVSTVTVAPTVTYVQTIPVTTYYFQPYYYPAYDYGYYPPVSFSFGWYGGGCGNGCCCCFFGLLGG